MWRTCRVVPFPARPFRGSIMKTKKTISVIGCGGWGTALSLLLCHAGHRTVMWGVDPRYMECMQRSRENTRYLPEVEIPEELRLSSDLQDCVENSEVIVTVTPTMYMREVCGRLAAFLRADHLIINAAKGIEEKTLLTGTGIVRDTCGGKVKLAGLYGPSHAEEVAQDSTSRHQRFTRTSERQRDKASPGCSSRMYDALDLQFLLQSHSSPPPVRQCKQYPRSPDRWRCTRWTQGRGSANSTHGLLIVDTVELIKFSSYECPILSFYC